jgi:endo-alpha-1,4-polygalactosaminidase (GH114 family)
LNADIINKRQKKLNSVEKRIITQIGHPVFTVEFVTDCIKNQLMFSTALEEFMIKVRKVAAMQKDISKMKEEITLDIASMRSM